MKSSNMKTRILPTLGLFGALTLASAAPTIPNPSFEANSFTVWPGYISSNSPITGWTTTNPARAGLNPASGSPFADNGAIPHGNNVAFIQSGTNSSLSTVISNLTSGETYKINFRVNARSGVGNTPNLKISIDGLNIINTAVTPVEAFNSYKHFAFDFTAAAESQTMTLSNDASGDHTMLLDDFSIGVRDSGWSYAAWNDDASSGVADGRIYSHAYNFGSPDNPVINGISFTGRPGGSPSISGSFSTSGLFDVFNNDVNNVTGDGGSRQLARDFVYGNGGLVGRITIQGLAFGKSHVATIYSVGWENGTRAATFSVGDDRLTVNQDQFGDNNGIRVSYNFTANSSSITLNYVPLQASGFHTCGFSVYEVPQPSIANPSFEIDPVPPSPGFGPITGWTLSGGGLNDTNGPFHDNGAIPDGTKVAFIHTNGALSQVVTGFIAGVSYQLRYFENARNCCGGAVPFAEVWIGGVTIVEPHAVLPVGGANPYREILSDPFVATATSLELAFIKSSPGGGDATLLIDNVNFVPTRTALLPRAVTLSADQIVQDSARLHGQANPSGSPTGAWFEWGADTNYGNVTAMQPVGAGLSLSNVSAVLNGLAGQEYHYRLVASNAFGIAAGADKTFTLPGFYTISIPGLPGVRSSSVAWGDYDNDGRLDFLITGNRSGEAVSQLWRNTGSGFSNVTASVAPGLPGFSPGSLAWADFDNDGRLDFLITGEQSSGGLVSQLWRNNVPGSNAPPAAPAGLSSTVSGGTVSLNWNAPADDRTPAAGLNYNLRIGTTPGGSNIVYGQALANGTRLVPQMGNAQTMTDALYSLPPGRTYYWSVQAVDSAFAGGPFAPWQAVEVAPLPVVIITREVPEPGKFGLRFVGPDGAYEVQRSLDLSNWTTRGSGIAVAARSFEFTDIDVPAAGAFYRVHSVFPAGLVTWWRGEDNYLDSVGPNHGSAFSNAGPTFVTGQRGRALSFNGTTEAMFIGRAPISVPWTACFWVKREDAAGPSAALLTDSVSGLKLEQWQFTQQVGFTAFGIADYSFNYITPANTWTHLTFVGGPGGTILYVNGTAQETNAATINLPLNILGVRETGLDYLKGQLDETVLFNRALSPAEVQQVFNVTRGP